MSTPSTPIAEVQGGLVCLEGVVRASDDAPLVAPVSGRACVCYEVHGGLFGESREEKGQPFFLDDGSGRARIAMDRYRLELGALRKSEALDVLDADINAVALQLSDLKVAVRNTPSDRDKQRELTQLKGLATLLCAIRAHARGNVHTGGSLEGQQRYITAQSKAYRGDTALRQLPERYFEKFDAVLVAGQRARVIGEAHWERGGHGYRDSGRSLSIRAPSDGVLIVEGEGAQLAAVQLTQRAEAAALVDEAPPPPRVWPWLAALAAVIAVLYVALC